MKILISFTHGDPGNFRHLFGNLTLDMDHQGDCSIYSEMYNNDFSGNAEHYVERLFGYQDVKIISVSTLIEY